jgi:hypothetical protein
VSADGVRLRTGIRGEDIYSNLRAVIYAGEEAAKNVQNFLKIVAANKIEAPTKFSFNDAGKTRFVAVTANVRRDNQLWDFEMRVTNAANQLYFQLLWNKDNTEAVAVMDVGTAQENSTETTKYRIDYKGNSVFYDKEMTISLSRNPQNATDTTQITNLKLFVAQTENIVTVVGNTHHPKLHLLFPISSTDLSGRNYAFVLKANTSQNIGVAKLSLPPSSISMVSSSFFDNYSVYQVIDNFLVTNGVTDRTVKSIYLNEAHSPAYFDRQGYYSSGAVPLGLNFSSNLTDLSGLLPFTPYTVAHDLINFY